MKKENNRFLKISHPAKKEHVGAPPSPARGERDVTALIFSYFLPDPSLVELTKRFEFDSSRRPELSFITVGQDTTFPLPRYWKMYLFFFLPDIEKRKTLRFSQHCFWFSVCVYWPFFPPFLCRGARRRDTVDRDPGRSWQDRTLISVVTVSLRKLPGDVCVQTELDPDCTLSKSPTCSFS